MRFTTRSEYGLVCLVHMAKHPDKILTTKSIVETEQFSITYIQKILLALQEAKIVTSHKGREGGYVLTRSPSQVTLKEIIEALEGSTFDVFCDPENRNEIVCTHFGFCGVRPIWRKTKELLDQFYGAISLEMIANDEVGSEKPRLWEEERQTGSEEMSS